MALPSLLTGLSRTPAIMKYGTKGNSFIRERIDLE